MGYPRDLNQGLCPLFLSADGAYAPEAVCLCQAGDWEYQPGVRFRSPLGQDAFGYTSVTKPLIDHWGILIHLIEIVN